MDAEQSLSFRVGWPMAFVPLVVFLALCVTYFVVFDAFDLSALAMGGFLGLLVGAPFARDYRAFWDAAVNGIGSPTAVSIVLILVVVGMFASMIEASDVSGGFVWLAHSLSVSGAGFTVATFVAVSAIAISTGSSIGTMFTAFPIFYPAGVLLGASPSFLAGAILSGAILGDNLAPISDTTIISASSQRYRSKPGVADIGGVVSSRARYVAVAAGLSIAGFAVAGGGGEHAGDGSEGVLGEAMNPDGLWMLIPVVLTLVVAVASRDIFLAVTVGLAAGTVTALAAGLVGPGDVLNVADGTAGGFLLGGLNDVLGTVALVVAVFGIMGVLRAAGILDRLVRRITEGDYSRTPRGAEVAIAAGSSVFTVLFGGVNSASMITFGPVVDEIGGRVGLHPYRRANVMDCFAMGLSCVVPFLSAFLFIGSSLVAGHDAAGAVSTPALFAAMLYPLALTLVMAGAIVSGWGRRFEGPDGAPTTTPVGQGTHLNP